MVFKFKILNYLNNIINNFNKKPLIIILKLFKNKINNFNKRNYLK